MDWGMRNRMGRIFRPEIRATFATRPSAQEPPRKEVAPQAPEVKAPLAPEEKAAGNSEVETPRAPQPADSQPSAPSATRDAEAHYRMAMSLAMAQRQDEAALEFQEAIDLEPTNLEIRNAFGVMLLMRDDVQGAERQFRAALERGENAMSRHHLGIVLYRKKDFDAARAEFERALVLDPRSQDTIFYLAYLDYGVGNWNKARARLEECIALDATTQTASQARAALEKLPR